MTGLLGTTTTAPYPYASGYQICAPWNTTDASALWLPDRAVRGERCSLIVWCHGYTENEKTLGTDAAQFPVPAALAAAGAIIVSVYGHGNNWGNSTALTDVATAVAAVQAARSVDAAKIGIIGVSMGGLTALNAAAAETVAFKAVGCIQPVCNLAAQYAANASHAASIRTAYGIAGDGSDYASKTSGYDPALLDAADYPAVYYRWWADPADGVVDKEDNADLLQAKLASRAIEAEVYETSGGHGAATQFVAADVLDFFENAFGGF